MIYIGERTGLLIEINNSCNHYNRVELGNAKLSPLYRKVIIRLLFNRRVDVELFNEYDIEEFKKKFFKMKNIEEFNVFCYENGISLQVGINSQSIKVYSRIDDKLQLINSQQISSYKLSNMSYNKFLKLCGFSKVEVEDINEMLKPANILLSSGDKRISLLKITKKKKVNIYANAVQSRNVYDVTDERIKIIQKKINTYLNLLQYTDEEHMCSFAYQKGKSYKDYLEVHCGAQTLLKTDISDFFDSIDVERLEHKLKTKLGIDELTDRLKEQILIEEREKIEDRIDERKKIIDIILSYSIIKDEKNKCIAQGFVTSPALSNIYMEEFDRKVMKWASDFGYKYSRYCDDIIISSETSIVANDVLEVIAQFCKGENLVINKAKTQIMSGVLKVSNVIIGNELSLPNKYYRSIYNILAILLNEINPDIHKRKINEYLKNNSKTRTEQMYKKTIKEKNIYSDKENDYIFPFLQHIKGKLEYAIHINPYKIQIARCVKLYDQLIESLYPDSCRFGIHSIPFKVNKPISDTIKVLINKRKIKHIPLVKTHGFYTIALEIEDIKNGIEVLSYKTKEKTYFNYKLVNLDNEQIDYISEELKVEHFIGEEPIYYASKMMNGKMKKISENLHSYKNNSNKGGVMYKRENEKIIFIASDYNMFFLTPTKKYFQTINDIEFERINKQRTYYYGEEENGL